MKKEIHVYDHQSSYFWIGNHELAICDMTLKDFFCIPDKITKIIVICSDKPLRESYRITLKKSAYYYRDGSFSHLEVGGHLVEALDEQIEFVKKWIKKHKKLYARVEYYDE